MPNEIRLGREISVVFIVDKLPSFRFDRSNVDYVPLWGPDLAAA